MHDAIAASLAFYVGAVMLLRSLESEQLGQLSRVQAGEILAKANFKM